jgi:hypothetical protein
MQIYQPVNSQKRTRQPARLNFYDCCSALAASQWRDPLGDSPLMHMHLASVQLLISFSANVVTPELRGGGGHIATLQDIQRCTLLILMDGRYLVWKANLLEYSSSWNIWTTIFIIIGAIPHYIGWLFRKWQVLLYNRKHVSHISHSGMKLYQVNEKEERPLVK